MEFRVKKTSQLDIMISVVEYTGNFTAILFWLDQCGATHILFLVENVIKEIFNLALLPTILEVPIDRKKKLTDITSFQKWEHTDKLKECEVGYWEIQTELTKYLSKHVIWVLLPPLAQINFLSAYLKSWRTNASKELNCCIYLYQRYLRFL
jgi:hypothetical protein